MSCTVIGSSCIVRVTQGNTILNGVVDPTTEGIDGDFYVNTATNFFFGPKAAGVWPAGFELGGGGGSIVECRNITGSTLAAGTVVYINGANSDKPTIEKAIATSAATSDRTFGILIASLANNANGNVLMQGLLENQDTSGYSAGDMLWLSSSVAGGMQTTAPVHPLHDVFLGVVAKSHATTGTIAVSIKNGFEVSGLHDVLVTSIADGQILRWDNAALLWKNVNQDPAWTNIATTANNDLAIGTKAFRFTSTSTTITGVVAQADGTEIILHNASGTTIVIPHNSTSSAAANRFSNAGSGNNTLFTGNSARYKYSTAASRWILSDNQQVTVAAPILMSSASQVSMAAATSSTNGYLTSTNWTTFNNKLDGSGTSTNVAFFNSSTNVTSDGYLTWNSTNDRLGVQVSAASAEAAVHVKSITSTPIGDPTSFTASLVAFTPLDDCTGSATPTQAPGRLMSPPSSSATENASGATPWSAADTMDYYIQPYYDDSGTYREGIKLTQVGVTFAGSGNGVDLSWTNDNTGTVTRTGYVLYRNYNGGGYVEWLDVGAVTAYTDDNQDVWTSGTYPVNFVYDDYLADGTSRDYKYYSRAVIAPGTVYSPGFEAAATFTDDNSGDPFRVIHNVASTASLVRIIGSEDGSSYDSSINGAEGTNINEFKDSWVADNNVFPSSVGYVSDDVALNINYAAYKFLDVSGNTVYSNAASTSSVDPNDSNTYYVALSISWANPSNGVKVVSGASNTGKIVSGGTSATVYDTNNAFPVADFPDTDVVTPTGIVPAASIYEKDGNTNSASWLTVKGTSDYSRMDFVSSTDAKQLQIESSTTEGALKYNGTKNIRMNATQLGTYGVTPVARATTGGAASTFAANTSGIADDTATYDGYTLGQVVKALRNLGILT